MRKWKKKWQSVNKPDSRVKYHIILFYYRGWKENNHPTNQPPWSSFFPFSLFSLLCFPTHFALLLSQEREPIKVFFNIKPIQWSLTAVASVHPGAPWHLQPSHSLLLSFPLCCASSLRYTQVYDSLSRHQPLTNLLSLPGGCFCCSKKWH